MYYNTTLQLMATLTKVVGTVYAVLVIHWDGVYGDLDNIAKSVVYSYRRKNGF